MDALINIVWKLRIWKDSRGQELVEYALLAGFLVTACGAASPLVATNVSTVFSKIISSLDATGGADLSAGRS